MDQTDDRQYSVEVIVAGNCLVCGKPIEGDNIFLCDECSSKAKGEER